MICVQISPRQCFYLYVVSSALFQGIHGMQKARQAQSFAAAEVVSDVCHHGHS
jgi:hypothetical protein